jgi:hypothetical protein
MEEHDFLALVKEKCKQMEYDIQRLQENRKKSGSSGV